VGREHERIKREYHERWKTTHPKLARMVELE
jgi:hypothetical protein